MTIPASGIPSLNLSMLDGLGETAGAAKPGASSGFGDVLRSKLDDLTTKQVDGESASREMATGDVKDVAQTMLRVEQANVSLQFATQLRNKAIEAYQEILRMQV